jgi:hypothetical protein
MRKSFIIIVFAFTAIFTTTNVVAQNGKTSVSIGQGQFFNSTISERYSETFLTTTNVQQTTEFTPILAIKLERRVLKHFSIGLNYNTLSARSERTTESSGFLFWSGTKSHEKIDAKISGGSVDIKGFVYSNTAFQAYIGTNVGLLSTTESIDKQLINADNIVEQKFSQTTESSTTALLGINLGARYFVTPNVGLYGEIGATSVYGLGGTSFQGGVICRF